MKNKKTSDNDTDKTGEQPGAMNSNCAHIKSAATVVGEVISMCVVPVRLRHCNSQKEVKTFALLESYIQDVFVIEWILKELGCDWCKGRRFLLIHQKYQLHLN